MVERQPFKLVVEGSIPSWGGIGSAVETSFSPSFGHTKEAVEGAFPLETYTFLIKSVLKWSLFINIKVYLTIIIKKEI